MGLRDRLNEHAARLGEEARKAAASESAQRVKKSARNAVVIATEGPVSDTFNGFRALLADDEKALSIEAYLLALVGAVRKDERDEEESRREVYVAARKRRRRLGLISFGAGPLAGIASRLADLYCEAAVVCDVADHHDLDLDDEEIAAHLLVLWSIADDFAQADHAMRGDSSVAAILQVKLLEHSGIELPEEMTKTAIAKVLWEFHQLDIRDTVVGAKKAAGGQPIRSVAFTGHRTKKVMKKTEKQLDLR